MSDFVLSDREKAEEEEEFLKTFGTLIYKRPKSRYHLWVFWMQDDHQVQQQQQRRFQINDNNNNDSFSADVDNRRMISDKIKDAFLCADFSVVDEAHFIIQFWAPVTTSSGRSVLSTTGQPFAVTDASENLSDYRLRCMEYQYSIDDHNDHDYDPAMIISDSPTATAFLNRFPELVLLKNLKGKVARGSPLDYALDCMLQYSYMLPVYFFPPTTSSCCVGVLEFSTWSIRGYETMITMIKTALKEVGLAVFQIQDRIPYQKIDGLITARDEIEQALKIVCESTDTSLVQVWIAFVYNNHVPFSSSSEGIRKEQILSLKLTGYLYDTGPEQFPWFTRDYCQLCDTFPLEMGEDIVVKTLEDHKSRICNDISKLSDDALVKRMFHYSNDDRYSKLAICFNSIRTGDFYYVFEFIWGEDPDSNVEFVEELLLKLKELLPSFKLISGGALGELDLINVGDSTAIETRFLKIFQGKKLLPIPEVLEEGKRIPEPMPVDSAPSEAKYKATPIPLSRERIEQQFGNTLSRAAQNLKVSLATLRRNCRKLGILTWKGPNKRKANDLYSNQSDKNEEVTGTIPEPLPVNRFKNTLTIKAKYADDMIQFSLLIFEATFETVMEEIGTRLELTPGTYKVKFRDEYKEWIVLTSEQDISYIKTFSDSVVLLHVLPSTQPISGATD